MKTVLFVSPTGTLDNGAEIAIVNFMEYLVSNGYIVINIVPQAYHFSQTEYFDHCTSLGIQTYFIPIIKWWWEDAPGGLPGTSLSRSKSYRDNILFIRNIIKEYSVDVVISNTVNVFQGAVAASCENTKHIWLIHEFPENEFEYYKSKIPFISEFSDAIFAVQGNLQLNLEELFYPKEIHSFVPFSKNTNNVLNDSKKNRIVSVGLISKRKNQLELLEAYKMLKNYDVELVFIGSYEEEYYKVCLEYIEKHNIKNVTFMGYMDNPWSVVTDKDICVFPSSMETFGLVYVEAVLNTVPSIISDNPGHISAFELLGVGEIYPLGDIKALSDAMNNSLLKFPSLKLDYLKLKNHLEKIYSEKNAYINIVEEINNPIQNKSNNLYFIKDIISIDEPESKLKIIYKKVSYIFEKAKFKFLKRT